MLGYVREMTKMTWKVLLRNKFFLFFAVAIPLLATLLLNISSGDKNKAEVGQVTVLEKLNTQMAYLQDVEKFQIKVYNRCEKSVSQHLVKMLAKGGLFQVFEVKSAKFSESEIMDSARYTSMHDKVDAIVVIGAEYAEQIKSGTLNDSIALYRSGSDKRYEMLQKYLMACVNEQIQKQTMKKAKVSVPVPEGMQKEVSAEEVENNEKSRESAFDMEIDSAKTGILGNVMALITMAFIMSGTIILGTIHAERDNLVYTRILLTHAGPYSYIASKFIIIVITSLIETVVAMLSYHFFVMEDVGLSIIQFAVILFSMALIFNSWSVGVGTCCGNTLTACLVSFSTWVVTALLGGMYFDISNASDTYKRVASLMPQRWGLKAATLFMRDDMTGYPLLLIVTIAYVVLVLLVGVLGLKLAGKSE